MKKYFLLLSLAFAVSFTACKPKEAETTATVNLDAVGEADSLANFPNSLDEANVIQATCNGAEKEFKFLDPYMNPDPKYKAYFNRRKDGSGCAISFARATHNDLRQKITIVLGNLDAETLQYPYEWKFDPANPTKSAKVVYEVKKSAVPILYYSDNATTNLKLTGYKDGVLEGTFSCKVVNQGKRVIDITDGSFKMKLDKIEQ
jgi:hypothetical protein